MAIIESHLSSALSLGIGFDYFTFKCQNDLLNTEIRQERKGRAKTTKKLSLHSHSQPKHYPKHWQFKTNLKNLSRILWIYKKEIQDGSGNPFDKKERRKQQVNTHECRRGGLSTQSPLRAADPEGVIKKDDVTVSRPRSAANTVWENIPIGCETSLLKLVNWIFQKNIIIIILWSFF